MQKKGLPPEPHAVFNLQGDTARGEFINHFKEVQRLKTQLDQYTDLTPEDKNTIENTLPINQLKAFRGVYLETAQRLRTQQTPHKTQDDTIAQLDFEFVLFASTIVDYDYIMRLMSQFSQGIERQAMGREELIALIASDAKLMNEREDITEYINTLKSGAGLSEQTIRQGYENFKTTKKDHELKTLAKNHTLEPAALQAFVDITLQRMILDGDLLTDLFAPLELGWKARIQKELALMQDLIPILKKLAQGHDFSGLKAYE
jgi:type I restriction enzyme R subunit